MLFWATAIPYDYLEKFLERAPNLSILDVLNVLMKVLVAEIEALHRSLCEYGCDNFVLIGCLIIHGAPPADSPYVREQSVQISQSGLQRSVAHLTLFESILKGAHFKHEVNPNKMVEERQRVMNIFTPYTAWDQCGRDPTYDHLYMYNRHISESRAVERTKSGEIR